MKYPAAASRRLAEGACLKLLFTYALVDLLVYCGCAAFIGALAMRMRLFENQQCRMVAQNFFRRTEIFTRISFANSIQNPKQRACQVSKM
jgi:hypothetical protein